jgi:hypothetical protein
MISKSSRPLTIFKSINAKKKMKEYHHQTDWTDSFDAQWDLTGYIKTNKRPSSHHGPIHRTSGYQTSVSEADGSTEPIVCHPTHQSQARPRSLTSTKPPPCLAGSKPSTQSNPHFSMCSKPELDLAVIHTARIC